jgi:hypothetical protein
MATPSQIDFFRKLSEEKDIQVNGKPADPKGLQEEFAELNDKSASAWIERAIALPKRDDSDDPITEAPF